MRIFLISILALSLFSCSSKSEEEIAIESITQMEDSLKKNPSVSNAPKLKLADKYLDFQRQFPKDERAPEFLDKAHMVYSGIGLYVKSVKVGDQLLKEYPKYINRQMILESQAVSYDLFLVPRDSTKVRYYYSLLLKEGTNLDRTKREEINFRLKNNHLTIEELIVLQANSAN